MFFVTVRNGAKRSGEVIALTLSQSLRAKRSNRLTTQPDIASDRGNHREGKLKARFFATLRMTDNQAQNGREGVILSRLCEGSRLYLRRWEHPPQYSTQKPLRISFVFFFWGQSRRGSVHPFELEDPPQYSTQKPLKVRFFATLRMTGRKIQSLRGSAAIVAIALMVLVLFLSFSFGESIERGQYTPSKDKKQKKRTRTK